VGPRGSRGRARALTQRITPYLAAVGWLVLVAAIGWLDYSTAPEYSFGLLYLLAVLPAAWLNGRSVGLIVAVGATVAWFISDQAAGPTAPIGAVVWNALSLALLFCAGAVLVDRVRRDRMRLVENESQRDRFFRVIERELPRPAGSLSLALDRLHRDGVLPAAAFEELRRDAERVQFLARDFVALGQLQSERLILSREPVDLRTLITELVRQRPDRTRIFVNVQEGQSFKISADAARIAQAFTALLDEAAQASEEDIRIDAERHANSVKVAISVGVARNDTTLRPAKDDERVVGFELARLVCEAHGGTFALFRRPVSRGLRAVVTLPRVRLAARVRGGQPLGGR
jgi:K+-sensing histidine kinase KdpD